MIKILPLPPDVLTLYFKAPSLPSINFIKNISPNKKESILYLCEAPIAGEG
jgi:hypothetical protein